MEPKPVISYFGDKELIGNVLQKKLQPRFKALQLSSLPKDDPPCSAFSAICNGVEFTPLSAIEARAKVGPLPLHQRPALHTFWTAASDVESYRTHVRPLIAQWLGQLEQLADGAECLIVYCVTAEVRAKRHRAISTITGSVDEKIRGDFRGKVDDVFLLRLASSEENRVIESFQAFTARANQMCIAKFHKDIEKEAESVVVKRARRTEPEEFYNVFLQKVNLAVVYELTLCHEEALQLYSEASSDLEESLAMYGGSESPPGWLEAIRHAPCTTWDYPKLVWSHLAWRYLPAITAGSSPLLHTQTFLLMRLCHLLFLLERGWTVSELCISTLHCLARQITALKLSLPGGAFDCWAYMTCQEAVLAIMARISADSVVSATSSLLLVRAELWHYALQKLHAIGVLCELMPSCNIQNHDTELVKRITAGITPVPFEADATRDPMEDEGKKLIEILSSPQDFQTAYLMLGEMVVGAFKHAGRRRMAFCVGTMMAQFHRDMGLVHEAEQLLSDICHFYSEDHWVQLSTKTYSLLADCQKKLKMEDKHINTMLLLASFPPYPGAAHDPNHWFDSLMDIAKHSHYQKLLMWDPLLEMSSIRPVGGAGRSHNTKDTIRMELVIKYHGPKIMKPIFISLLLRAVVEGQNVGSSEPSEATPSPIHMLSDVATGNLEELDLDSDSSRLPKSRPIGHSKTRTPNNVVTLIPSSNQSDPEVGGAKEDWRSKVPEFMLTIQSVELTLGENRIFVEGKPREAGRYLPHKVNLKCGALDFLLEDPKLGQPVEVLPSRVDVGVSLEPELGEFLAGYPQECVLKLKTGKDSSIPEGAGMRVLTNNTLQCTVQNSTIRVDRVAGTSEAAFTLPAVLENSEYSTPLTFTVPSTQTQGSSLVGTTESCDSADQSEPCAWLHELQVFCDWLSPVHTAVLPLTVYEPLTVTHKEHTAGENTFLQLFLCNPSPLPISLGTSMLAADIELSRLHSELPEVLYAGESFSCVWKVAPGPATAGGMTPASYHVQFRPLLDGKDMPMKEFRYEFRLSNMRTIYEVKASVEPMKEHTRVTTKRSAYLEFGIKNITKSRLTPRLRYDVTADDRMWKLQESPWGDIESPKPGQLTQLSIKAMPLRVGLVELPTLTLSQYLADNKPKGTDSPVIKPKGTDSPAVTGKKELSASNNKCIPLSNSQVYNLSLGEVVTIAPVQLSAYT